MATKSERNKRPKISELPSYKPPEKRQLKVTAFFKRLSSSSEAASTSDTLAIASARNPTEATPQISCDGIKLNSSSDTLEITINDDIEDGNTSDYCEEVFCSESFQTENSMISLSSSTSSASLNPITKSKRKYSEADFVEFSTFNYNDETIIDKSSSKERRRCPFYKRIPYTEICVDAFNFAKEDGLKHYFLTHFHADHYIGMTKGFNKPIYCTPITGRLLRHKFKVSPKFIHCHELDMPFFVDKVRCTFFDANHCPGAAIIIFELPSGHRYLHTGDFRACPEMEKIYDLNCAPIDCCFLDTTFCDKTKTFPSQAEVLENAVSVCRYALEKNPRTLIVCGSYCIGKEKVFMAVAEALDLKIWCNNYKRGYFNCLQYEALNARLTDKQDEAKIHVLPLKSLWKRGMREYLEKHYDHFEAIVALRPSGWEYKRNKHMVPEVEGNIAIYPVPYSEHSSYTDLERFITWLRPRRIIPTVNMGDPIKRGQMNLIFKKWRSTPKPITSFMVENAKSEPNSENNEIGGSVGGPLPQIKSENGDTKPLALPSVVKSEIKQESNEDIEWDDDFSIDVNDFLQVDIKEDHSMESSSNLKQEVEKSTPS